MPAASAIAAKSGFCRSVPKGTNPAAIISSSTKFSESLSNTSVFTGRSFCTNDSSSPSIMANPPSPAIATTWRAGSTAWAPTACVTALAMEPWDREPMIRRRPFIVRYREAQITGEPTSGRNTTSSSASSSRRRATYCGCTRPRPGEASWSRSLRVLA